MGCATSINGVFIAFAAAAERSVKGKGIGLFRPSVA
jgi:hypothetical protein